MSTKGGYQILNLKNTKLTAGTASTIKGTWETLEGNYHKPVLVSGLVIGTTEYNDTFAEFTLSNTTYTATIYGYTLTVTNADAVTATAVTG